MIESVLGQVRMYNEQAFLGLGEILLDGKLIPKKIFNLQNEAT
jgi:tRNA pseudouridine55 synthase